MPKRRKYSEEYKREAIQLLESSDKSASQVARDLGINNNMLGRWRREFSTDLRSRSRCYPGSPQRTGRSDPRPRKASMKAAAASGSKGLSRSTLVQAVRNP